jgi:hypothetical protein
MLTYEWTSPGCGRVCGTGSKLPAPQQRIALPTGQSLGARVPHPVGHGMVAEAEAWLERIASRELIGVRP